MPKRVLITGASGFIGRNLGELLTGYDIFTPTRAELDLVSTEAVESFLNQHRFDAVIHAATGRSNRKTTAPDLFKNNCRMFFNFARCSHLYGRMLHFGSGAEYDRRVYQPLMPESYFDTSVPEDDYAFAKYIAAKYTELARNIFNLRLFGVFGKYEAWEVRFISNACCRVLHGMPITLRQNIRFDYLDIRDLVPLTAWFIENQPHHQTYNLTSGQPVDLLTLAHLVAKISGRNPEIKVANEGMGREYSGSNERLIAEIGPYSFRPLETSVRDLYNWYESNLSEIDPELLRFD